MLISQLYLPIRRKRSVLNCDKDTGANTPANVPSVLSDACSPFDPLFPSSSLPLKLRKSLFCDSSGALSYKNCK